MKQRALNDLADHLITIRINGQPYQVSQGSSVVAALILARQMICRRSVSGEARFAVCGMGVCHECRVTINGQPQQLACQNYCVADMEIVTAEATP